MHHLCLRETNDSIFVINSVDDSKVKMYESF